MPETVTAARQAVRSYEWDQAIEGFLAADRDGDLTPDDLVLLADANWWTGRPDDAEKALERAFAAYVEEGRKLDAALVAARLTYFAMRRLNMAVAAGWVGRAERLLEGESETPAHAWLALHRLTMVIQVEGDIAGALAMADDVIALAMRTGSPDVASLALSMKGMSKVFSGEWEEGLALVDEAAVMAMSEQRDLHTTSGVYCIMIAACTELSDYRRASEWTDRAEKWMSERGVGGYPSVCQVHRAELKLLSGAWPEAMEAALQACAELEKFRLLNDAGFARYEIGELKRRMGDLAGAEESFASAYEYGHPAQPGMALLLLDQGRVEEAAGMITGVLDHVGPPATRSGSASLIRASMLPAQVEIALATDDTGAARAAAEELAMVAEVFKKPAWEARALTWGGAVDFHEGDFGAAMEKLGRAWRLWQEVGLPYENARARTLLGRARLAKGDTMGAGLELRAARGVFARLGAKRDLVGIDELMVEAGLSAGPERTRETKTFMFTDIVGSTDLISLVGDEAWDNLREWHDRSLKDCFRRHRGEVVNQMGDGFFVAFDDAREALDCAVDIQRRLAAHRKDHGFAPWVRIGIHTAEATRQGDDYTGGGVHTAARIGDLGGKEEIVVSAETLATVGELSLPISEARSVTLKGVLEPVEVRSLDWR